jgi:hypothetical protein
MKIAVAAAHLEAGLGSATAPPSAAARAQAALVRSLRDEIGRRDSPDELVALEEQLAEELDRLARIH